MCSLTTLVPGPDGGVQVFNSGVLKRQRAERRAFLVAAGVTVSSVVAGCGTPVEQSRSAEATGLALLVLAAAPKVGVQLPAATLGTLLENELSAAGKREVTPLARVRAVVGGARHAVISSEFAQSGRLVNESLQTVMATPLPVRRGLLVRIEQNDTDVLEPVIEPYRNLSGRSPSDRRRVVLAARRRVRIAATLLDLGTGSVRWRKSWSASPIARTDYVRYTGSSLTGSVSASLANSVVNGLGGPAAPPPPGLETALQAIFRELAETLAAT